MELRAKARLSVDIGGTFTDLVLHVGGNKFSTKVLTTSKDPETGFMAGVASILASAACLPGDVEILVHGTTLATNSLIERRGAKTALITTKGFRDTLEMGTESRYEQYDLNIDLPPPLVPRDLRFTVNERIDAKGNILVQLDEGEVEAIALELERLAVQSVAVGLISSYINSAHEVRIRQVLSRLLPDVRVTLSSEVSPEMREYQRFSTACANAYVQPLMSSYLERLSVRLDDAGFKCPMFLMLSGGGVTTINTARDFPVRLVESGPAGGAIFSARIAEQLGLGEVLSFDMGGTTAKICFIENYLPQSARSFEVARIYRFKKGSGLPLSIPVIEMVEIGAGGGSIAHVNALGNIQVGPQSASSEPGPACYGLGGDMPTVTDADLVLGKIDPDRFAGGRLPLDASAARDAIETKVARPSELSIDLAAFAINEIVDENMSSAARVHGIESGKDVARHTMIAFGGAAPLHALRVAEKLGITRVVIPGSAGVGSAVGFLLAPVAFEISASVYMKLAEFTAAPLNNAIDRIRDRAMTVVLKAGDSAQVMERRMAFIRYIGQGHQVPIAIPVRTYGEDDARLLQIEFEREYERLYGRLIPGLGCELLGISLSVSAPRQTEFLKVPACRTEQTYAPDPVGHRNLFDATSARHVSAAVFARAGLAPGARIEGPALIEEDETTSVITSRFVATVDDFGFLVCTMKQSAENRL